MLIKQLRLKNFLSFGPEGQNLELGPLNVFIGPNGSGKSNLIEVIHLLQAAPNDLAGPIRKRGRIEEWIWKGGQRGSEASIDAIIERVRSKRQSQLIPLRYHLGLGAIGVSQFNLSTVDERIEDSVPLPGRKKPCLYFATGSTDSQSAKISGWDKKEKIHKMETGRFDMQNSILGQIRYPDRYPEIAYLGDAFGSIRIYRDWPSVRSMPQRWMQKSELPTNPLEEDASNLGLVLNYIRSIPDAKEKLLKFLGMIHEGVTDFDVHFEDNKVQVVLKEGDITVPITCLSAGTLRYLCLLAILCHPANSGLVCIEEPERGLHPDIISPLTDVLRDASERMQIIVTTHSDYLVDSLTDVPESVFVTEKHDGETTIKRLSRAELGGWLEEYSLGDLWTTGVLGGNRW